jgi:CheY-like chemotaxis protein
MDRGGMQQPAEIGVARAFQSYIIIADVIMPVPNGIDAARQILKITPM